MPHNKFVALKRGVNVTTSYLVDLYIYYLIIINIIYSSNIKRPTHYIYNTTYTGIEENLKPSMQIGVHIRHNVDLSAYCDATLFIHNINYSKCLIRFKTPIPVTNKIISGKYR